ncbi:MAG: hypothetical protein PHT60_00960 [Acidiphilium sp.]|nr:hypothetical protein [Acidiphilium sp.]MDD4934325.1 hypothetical protein [Acidiphilium sp.]
MLEVDAPAATEGDEIARKISDRAGSSLNDHALQIFVDFVNPFRV